MTYSFAVRPWTKRAQEASGFDWAALGAARREALGDALHHAMHPHHPWSGCSDPEWVYDLLIPRFLAVLRDAGFDVHRTDDTRFLDEALNSGDGTYRP